MAVDVGLDGSETLSSKSHDLIRRLRDLIHLLEGIETSGKAVVPSTSISDILDRFLLWCANLGALHKPTKKLSLDQRLADAPEVKDQIFVNFADFNEAIEDLSGIIAGDNPNRDILSSDDLGTLSNHDEEDLHDGVYQDVDGEGDGSPMDEAHMNLELMAEAMKSLFQLGVLVRKSGPRDRFQRALQQSASVFDESSDIDYVKQKYPKLNKAQYQWLSKRLGTANAKRRQFIKYCREHKAHLDAHNDELRDGATEKLSSKATTFVHNVQSGSMKPPSWDEDDAISIMTATTTLNADTKLKLPTLGEISLGADHFECPICFTLQSLKSESAWKIHAFRDLKAYVCTVGGTECNSLLFGDRNAWFEHELQHHRSHYNCNFCDEKGFQSKASVMTHISSSHNQSSKSQVSLLVDASYVTPSQFMAQDCPFCDEWATILEQRMKLKGENDDTRATNNVTVSAMRFKRHVATHQEQLAIFVVPRSSDPDSNENEKSDNTSVSSFTSFKDIHNDESWFGNKTYHLEPENFLPPERSRVGKDSSYYGVSRNVTPSKPSRHPRPKSYYLPQSTQQSSNIDIQEINPHYSPPRGGPTSPRGNIVVHQPNRPASDGTPDESPFLPLRRRNSVLETSNEHEDVRQRMPPPPRPSSTRPSRPVFHSPPRPAATRESAISIAYFSDEDSTTSSPVSRELPEYGSGNLRPRPRRRNSLDLDPFDEDDYEIEPASRGRQRPSKYYSPRRSNEKVRDGLPQDYELGGMTQPLTAESLRLSKHMGRFGPRSTRSSASGGESDRAQFGGGSVGSSDGGDDVTIKVPAGAVVTVGGTRISSQDGGINIGRNVGAPRKYANYRVPDDADGVSSGAGQAQSSLSKSPSPEGNKKSELSDKHRGANRREKRPKLRESKKREEQALKTAEEVGAQPSASQTQDKPEGGSQVRRRDALHIPGLAYVQDIDEDGNIIPDSLRYSTRET